MVLNPGDIRLQGRWLLCLTLVTAVAAGQTPSRPGAPPTRDSVVARAQREPSGLPSPEGWLGVALDCTGCGWMKSDRSATPVWYGGLPTIAAVDPNGPAAKAGIAPGDVLVEVDGHSIVDRGARQKFGAVKPGQKITFTVLRRGTMEPITVTARWRPDRVPGAAAPTSDEPQNHRFTGTVSGVRIDVWSRSPAAVEVDSAGGLTIRTEMSTVRVLPPPKGKR
jgi:membrane-associated protease RseP (regulator of RpoE activity)